MEKINVTIMGMGYIGLPTAGLAASCGYKVNGVDVNKKIIQSIKKGEITINEPGLDKLIKKVTSNGMLSVSTSVSQADIYIIAVPTPISTNLEPDLSYIKSAASMISPYLKRGDLIILESTSPVGTTEKLAEWLSIDRKDLKFPSVSNKVPSDIYLAFCPERILPGRAIIELIENDRIIGGMTLECGRLAENFYKKFVTGETTVTEVRIAELTKLAENSYRDVNIAFANELSLICDKFEIDVWTLIKLANKHPRVNILNPGPGVGGHCIAVDPFFIIHGAPELSRLIKTSREVNDSKPMFVVEKTKKAIDNLLKKNTIKKEDDLIISCLGLTYKANVNDLRESPAISILNSLASETKCILYAVEPNIKALPENLNYRVQIESLQKILDISDIILLLVKHDEFKALDLSLLKHKVIIDTCGMFQIAL